MAPSPPSFPADRFAWLIEALCKVVAARGGRCAHRLPGPLIVWIWTRLCRIGIRVAALAARIEAGTYRPRRAPHRPAPPPAPPPRPPRQAPPLPLRTTWLLRLIPEAGFGAAALKTMLAAPEMAALLEENRQMRRLLRPLCHMLGARLPPLPAPPTPPPAPAPVLPLHCAARGAAPAPHPPGLTPTPQRWRLRPLPAPTTRPGACGPPVPA